MSRIFYPGHRSIFTSGALMAAIFAIRAANALSAVFLAPVHIPSCREQKAEDHRNHQKIRKDHTLFSSSFAKIDQHPTKGQNEQAAAYCCTYM